MKNRTISNDYRPSVFWSFNDVLEHEELGRQLEQLLKAGCSGGFLHSRVGLVTEYMSEEWMEAVRHCCREAEKQGTALWLYDEDRFPSGYAGGAVLARDDSLRTKAMCLIPAGEEANYSVLKVYKTAEDHGKHYTLALCAAKDGNLNFEGKCYVDLLDPRATQVFIEETHEKYKEAIGECFGKQIKGIFSDEFCYTQKAAFPCATVPFTTDMEEDFARRYGYDLVEKLELLFFDRPGYPEVRRDFYEFLTGRFIRSFTIPYNNWCQDHGLIFTGHLLHEDYLTTQPEWTGAVMPHYVHMQMPGIDKLGSDPDQLMTVKQVTSVAEQLGRRSLCESFGCSGHQFGPGEMKRMADWLCVSGINFINPHLTLYSARGERKRDYPPDFSWRQPWFEVSRGAFDHISRVCRQLHEGMPETDVLVIHPIQSVWAEFSPLHKVSPVFSIWAPKNPNAGQNFITETERYQKPFMDLTALLAGAGIAFHYGDEMVMADHGRFDDGIAVGRCRYRQVVVPPVRVLREHTLALLAEHARRFGKESVVFIGGLPACVPAEWAELFTVAADTRGALRLVNGRKSGSVEIRDAFSGQWAEAVHHRVCVDEEGRKTVFAVNTDRTRGYDLVVTLADGIRPVIWDTVTGEYFQVPGRVTEKEFVCRMHLKVGGSAMLIYEDPAGLPMAVTTQSGAAFTAEMQGCLTAPQPEVTVADPNVLPLNVVRFAANGRELRDRPVESLWQTFFYKLPDGTPFEAEYRFWVDRVPAAPVTALIEMARNLDEVLLNGQPVQVRRGHDLACFDPCFDSFETTALRLGENTICLRGRKCSNINGIGSHARVKMGAAHPATELESIFICGDFGVAPVGGGSYAITDRPQRVSGAVNKGLYPFYMGRLRSTVSLPAGATRVRVDARAHAVVLRVRGEEQVSYLHPFEFVIPQGEETLAEIRLYNSMENAFGPLHLSGRERMSMIGPVYFPDMKRYSAEPVLFDFGLWSVTVGRDQT
ncbi:MAG: hypothetical protein E7436_01620 [Ruminococcaceae bacterium]|nr:hypothetical protein [Oscillospiraceae bacterium]